MKKRKKLISAAVFILLIIFINCMLNFLLVQPRLTRIMFHELDKGDYTQLIIGTSHGSYGINSAEITDATGENTMNMCIGGEYMIDMYYILKEAIRTNDIDSVVMEVDYAYLTKKANDSMQSNYIYYAYPDTVNKLSYFWNRVADMDYRATLFPWIDYRHNTRWIFATAHLKTGKAYRHYDKSAVIGMNRDDEYMGDGFIYRKRNKDKNNHKGCGPCYDGKVNKDNIKYFKKIVKLCKEENIDLVMITTPLPDSTVMIPENGYDKAHEYICEMAEEEDVEYYDMNLAKGEEFDVSDDDFYDADGHMYGDSATRYSKSLGKMLKKRKDGKLVKSESFYEDLDELREAVSDGN